MITHTSLRSLSIGLQGIYQNIKYIEMCRNNISSLSVLENVIFGRLRSIDLSHNRIKCLRGHRMQFPKLEFISLRNNLIRSVSDLSEMKFPKLGRLDLSNNLLRSISDLSEIGWGETLPQGKVVTVFLCGNPWHCNDSFLWLREGLYGPVCNRYQGQTFRRYPYRTAISDVDDMQCDTPRHLKGTHVVPEKVINAAMLPVDICNNILREFTVLCWWFDKSCELFEAEWRIYASAI